MTVPKRRTGPSAEPQTAAFPSPTLDMLPTVSDVKLSQAPIDEAGYYMTASLLEDHLVDALSLGSPKHEDYESLDKVVHKYEGVLRIRSDAKITDASAKTAAEKYEGEVAVPYKEKKKTEFGDLLRSRRPSILSEQEESIRTQAEEIDVMHFGGEHNKELRVTEIKAALRQHLANTLAELETEAAEKAAEAVNKETTDIEACVNLPEVKKYGVDQYLHILNNGTEPTEEKDGLDGIADLIDDLGQAAKGQRRFIGKSAVAKIRRVAPEEEKVDEDDMPKTIPDAITRISKFLDQKLKGASAGVAEVIFDWLKDAHPVGSHETEINKQFSLIVDEVHSSLKSSKIVGDELNTLINRTIRTSLMSSGLLEQNQAPMHQEVVQPKTEAMLPMPATTNKYAAVAQIGAQLPVLERIALAKDIKAYIDGAGDPDLLQLVVDMVADLEPNDPERATVARQLLGLTS